MRNAVLKLLMAYFQCLESMSVPVYIVAVPATEKGNHILLKPESEIDLSNKTSFVTNPIITAEVVTVHEAEIDATTVEGLDDEMRQLIWPSRRTLGLPPQEDIQILLVKPQSINYTDDFDGTRYEHRKITRFENRINQL